MASMELVEVPVIAIPEWWPMVRELVEKMRKTGNERYSTPAILNDLLNQKAQLWVAVKEDKVKAAAIGEITQYPLMKCCGLTVAGEEMEEWKIFIANIEKWAKDRGCKAMRLIAREGWQKILKEYQKTNIVLEKTI